MEVSFLQLGERVIIKVIIGNERIESGVLSTHYKALQFDGSSLDALVSHSYVGFKRAIARIVVRRFLTLKNMKKDQILVIFLMEFNREFRYWIKPGLDDFADLFSILGSIFKPDDFVIIRNAKDKKTAK